jgi:hypothetical protein
VQIVAAADARSESRRHGQAIRAPGDPRRRRRLPALSRCAAATDTRQGGHDRTGRDAAMAPQAPCPTVRAACRCRSWSLDVQGDRARSAAGQGCRSPPGGADGARPPDHRLATRRPRRTGDPCVGSLTLTS